MSENSILETRDIVAGYGDVVVLKHVDLELKEGEIVALIGPNGAGKSTLLKAIFGLLELRSGEIWLKNKNITGLDPHQIIREGMNYVPQMDSVFPTLSVRENFEMGGYIMEDCSERVSEVFDFFPALREKENARVYSLSGGQQKMVAMGRGLILKPDVLMLDEPSAGLAPRLASDVYEKIEEINEAGRAIIMVEQNTRRALGLCDRGYVLDDGRNRFQGSGEELLNDDQVARLYLGG